MEERLSPPIRVDSSELREDSPLVVARRQLSLAGRDCLDCKADRGQNSQPAPMVRLFWYMLIDVPVAESKRLVSKAWV